MRRLRASGISETEQLDACGFFDMVLTREQIWVRSTPKNLPGSTPNPGWTHQPLRSPSAIVRFSIQLDFYYKLYR